MAFVVVSAIGARRTLTEPSAGSRNCKLLGPRNLVQAPHGVEQKQAGGADQIIDMDDPRGSLSLFEQLRASWCWQQPALHRRGHQRALEIDDEGGARGLGEL